MVTLNKEREALNKAGEAYVKAGEVYDKAVLDYFSIHKLGE